MYPPVGIGQIRVAEKHDIVLGGKLHIPAGTVMWVSASLSIAGLTTAGECTGAARKAHSHWSQDQQERPSIWHRHEPLAQQYWIRCAGAPSCHPERLFQLG